VIFGAGQKLKGQTNRQAQTTGFKVKFINSLTHSVAAAGASVKKIYILDISRERPSSLLLVGYLAK